VSNENLSKLRDRLSFINLELAGSRLTSREIVSKFMERERELIEATSSEILQIGLIQLLNQVSNRRPASVEHGQADLFAGHNDFPVVVVVPVTAANGKKRAERRRFVDMTLAEALEWLDGHLRTREADDQKLIDARQIIERAAPHIKDTSKTIEDGLLSALEAEEEERGVRYRGERTPLMNQSA
jgi:hypothetical protein